MNKINPVALIVLVLILGFLVFKIMSFFGCYVQMENVNECWKLIAW